MPISLRNLFINVYLWILQNYVDDLMIYSGKARGSNIKWYELCDPFNVVALRYLSNETLDYYRNAHRFAMQKLHIRSYDNPRDTKSIKLLPNSSASLYWITLIGILQIWNRV